MRKVLFWKDIETTVLWLLHFYKGQVILATAHNPSSYSPGAFTAGVGVSEHPPITSPSFHLSSEPIKRGQVEMKTTPLLLMKARPLLTHMLSLGSESHIGHMACHCTQERESEGCPYNRALSNLHSVSGNPVWSAPFPRLVRDAFLARVRDILGVDQENGTQCPSQELAIILCCMLKKVHSNDSYPVNTSLMEFYIYKAVK